MTVAQRTAKSGGRGKSRSPAAFAAHPLSKRRRPPGRFLFHDYVKAGCPERSRTSIHGFRDRCPTIGRPGNKILAAGLGVEPRSSSFKARRATDCTILQTATEKKNHSCLLARVVGSLRLLQFWFISPEPHSRPAYRFYLIPDSLSGGRKIPPAFA